jgi:hypothetical protein
MKVKASASTSPNVAMALHIECFATPNDYCKVKVSELNCGVSSYVKLITGNLLMESTCSFGGAVRMQWRFRLEEYCEKR